MLCINQFYSSVTNITRYSLTWTLIIIAFLIWVVWQVFPGVVVLPQVLLVFGLELHWYGIFIATAIFASVGLATRRSTLFEISAEEAEYLFIFLIIGGFAGARLYHVLSSWQYYVEYPFQILAIYNGGLSIFGAVLGGLVALILFARRKLSTHSFLFLLDWLAPSLVLGQIIGRIGNLFNYEAYGSPTESILKMYVPDAFRFPGFENFSFFHPTFLYEIIGGLLIFWFLVKYSALTKRFEYSYKKGDLFWWWLVGYGVLRFFTEFLRIDSTFLFSNLKLNTVAASLMVFIGLVQLIRSHHVFYSKS